MKIVLVTSELAPYASTGELGDSVAQLANSLSGLGHSVTVITPHYPQVEAASVTKLPSSEVLPLELAVRVGARVVTGSVSRSRPAESHPNVVRIAQPGYYDRPSLYHDGVRDYRDNCERFVFLSRAAVEVIRLMKLDPDIIHCHDWQTGLVPALLRIEHAATPLLKDSATIMSVHNLCFQGQFWHWDMELTGLDWKYFNWRQMEFFGQLNLLKTGIVFSDAITVLGQDYARAVQSAEHGCGLHGVMRTRSEHLFGVSGGVEQYLEVYRQILRREEDAALFAG